MAPAQSEGHTGRGVRCPASPVFQARKAAAKKEALEQGMIEERHDEQGELRFRI